MDNQNIFKIVEIDSGFCRILLSIKNENGQKIYYCLQEDWSNKPLVLYRCTSKPWCEPEYPVTLKKDIDFIFEAPKGESQLEIKMREWIELNNYKVVLK